jgi:hypothetical protein
VRALRAGLGEIVGAAFEDGEPQSRQATCRTVLELSGQQILRVRAAYVGQGFEGDAQDLPPLDQLLIEAN